jgi:hypothetical protein
LRAYITAVFERSDVTNPQNYRPVALICILCKLMEHIIKDQLRGYLLDKSLISEQQYAFIIKQSTSSNLPECIHNWSDALNDCNSVFVIYIDFKSAFDSVVYLN